MRNVNRMVFLFFINALLWAHAAQAAEDVEGKIFYTTANIWYERQSSIESTNYHRGRILPIGTKVKIVKIFDGTQPVLGGTLDPDFWERSIQFKDEGGQSYRMVFIARHASADAGVGDLFRQYFSEKDPMAEDGAFTSLTAEEQKMVRAGEIAPGMSKAAVIMAYGYPPGHKTPSLNRNRWIYWENRFKTRVISFMEDRVSGDSLTGKSNSSIEKCIKACKKYTNRTSERCFDDCKPK